MDPNINFSNTYLLTEKLFQSVGAYGYYLSGNQDSVKWERSGCFCRCVRWILSWLPLFYTTERKCVACSTAVFNSLSKDKKDDDASTIETRSLKQLKTILSAAASITHDRVKAIFAACDATLRQPQGDKGEQPKTSLKRLVEQCTVQLQKVDGHLNAQNLKVLAAKEEENAKLQARVKELEKQLKEQQEHEPESKNASNQRGPSTPRSKTPDPSKRISNKATNKSTTITYNKNNSSTANKR